MTRKTHSFFLLAGALMFCMSSLPGVNEAVEVRSVELRSEKPAEKEAKKDAVPFEECDLQGQVLSDSKDGGCEEVTSEVDKDIKGSMTFVKNADDAKTVKVTVELEARFCSTGRCRVVETVHASQLKEFTQKTMNRLAAPAKVQKDKDAEVARAYERCEKNKAGDELKTPAERLNCRADHLLKIEDQEEANSYYRQHLKNRLVELLNSFNALEREEAREIVTRIGRTLAVECPQQEMPSTMTGNPFVSVMNVSFKAPNPKEMEGNKFIADSVCTMSAYSNYQTNQEDVGRRVQMLRATGQAPEVANGWDGMLKSQRLTWGEYFRRRGMQLQSPGYGFAGPILNQDLGAMNASYLARQMEIEKAYSGLLRPGSVTTANPAVKPQVHTQLLRHGIIGDAGLASGTVQTQTNVAVEPWPTVKPAKKAARRTR